jgi:hypothetical protein
MCVHESFSRAANRPHSPCNGEFTVPFLLRSVVDIIEQNPSIISELIPNLCFMSCQNSAGTYCLHVHCRRQQVAQKYRYIYVKLTAGGPGSIPATTRKKVVGLERSPLSLVSTPEELLDRKVAAPV